ncbi:MAG: hypothetical protein O4859_13625, partial [Trichodesmium sp. St18_bin1]|nr:hypothetical protein [Trichodesmium sp. St18_bin1]
FSGFAHGLVLRVRGLHIMSLCEARVGSVYVAIAKSQNKMYIFLFWHKFIAVFKLMNYITITKTL